MEKKPLNLTILIAKWSSISMFFLAGEVVLRTGAFAGLTIAAAFFIAFLLNIPFLKTIDTETDNLFRRFSLLIWKLEIIVLHFLAGMQVLQIVLGIKIWANFLINAVAFLILTLLFEKWHLLKKGSLYVKITLLFVMAIFLPIYIYLQEGLETVYHNLLFYHPRVLHLESSIYLKYFLISLVIFIGKIHLQIPSLLNFSGPHFGKGIRKLSVAVLILSTVFLAFSTMTIVAVTQDFPSNNNNGILLELIQSKASPIIFLVTVSFIYILSGITITNELHQIGSFSKSIKRFYSISLFFLIAISISIVFYIQKINLVEIFCLSGIMIGFASFLFLMSKAKRVIIFKKV